VIVTKQIVAPTVIPDEILPASAQPPSSDPAGVVGGEEGGVDGGVVGGIVGGSIGGILGGKVDGAPPLPPPPPPPPPPPSDGRVHIARDKPLGMFPLSQTWPQYPEDMRVAMKEDSLLIRYIIGKDGRVKSVEILAHAQFKKFDDATMRAVRFWRFKPMIKDGQPVEVVHELTVNFKLEGD
jgi:protein TonB